MARRKRKPAPRKKAPVKKQPPKTKARPRRKVPKKRRAPARKPARRKSRLNIQKLFSFLLTVSLFVVVPAAGLYYYFNIYPNRSVTVASQEEIVYGDLPPVNQNLQMENIREAEGGSVVDAYGLDDEQIKSLFSASVIDESQLKKMEAVTWSSTQKVIKSDDLLYLRMLHKNFDGQDQLGEMIVNKAIASDVLNAFYELYKEDYPIEKMVLLDRYNGDLELSRTDNNTSAFSLKLTMDSKIEKNTHAMGLAIDLNPFYNPIVTKDSVYEVRPYSAQIYADRDLDDEDLEDNYMIYSGDKAYEILSKYGFVWRGKGDNPQYQLFEYNGSGTNTRTNFTLSASYDQALQMAEDENQSLFNDFDKETEDPMESETLQEIEEDTQDEIIWDGQDNQFEAVEGPVVDDFQPAEDWVEEIPNEQYWENEYWGQEELYYEDYDQGY